MNTGSTVRTAARKGEADDRRAFDADWQRLWFATLTKPWASLAVVPTSAELDVTRLAEGLAAVGRQDGAKPVRLLKGRGARLEHVQRFVAEIDATVQRGSLVIVALDAPDMNPAAIPIARAATAVLLAVPVGQGQLSDVRGTVDALGRERIIGSVVLG